MRLTLKRRQFKFRSQKMKSFYENMFASSFEKLAEQGRAFMEVLT